MSSVILPAVRSRAAMPSVAYDSGRRGTQLEHGIDTVLGSVIFMCSGRTAAFAIFFLGMFTIDAFFGNNLPIRLALWSGNNLCKTLHGEITKNDRRMVARPELSGASNGVI